MRQPRPQRLGQVVAPAGDDLQPRAGDAPGQVVGCRHRDQRIVRAVQHQRGRLDARQPLGPVRVGRDGNQLARHRLRPERPLHAARDALAQRVRFGPVARAADHAVQAHIVVDDVVEPLCRRFGRPRARQQRAAHLEALLGQAAMAAGGHHQRQAFHAGRMGKAQVLGDHAAHGRAADMGLGDAQRVQHADGIAREVGDLVGGLQRQAQGVQQRRQRDVGLAELVKGLAEADVPVVEADDPETLGHQLFDQAVGPGDELHAQAHDHQQRLAVVRAVHLDFQAHTVAGELHQPRRPCHPWRGCRAVMRGRPGAR
mmetsp:Transcript_77776/g.215559  ORF Transcript_77776/g.215559 Transcript_77776/m.215559 type:complete len:313 (+) Transcript_77776:1155-2093(+)